MADAEGTVHERRDSLLDARELSFDLSRGLELSETGLESGDGVFWRSQNLT